jgi:hypothetical protein
MATRLCCDLCGADMTYAINHAAPALSVLVPMEGRSLCVRVETLYTDGAGHLCRECHRNAVCRALGMPAQPVVRAVDDHLTSSNKALVRPAKGLE